MQWSDHSTLTSACWPEFYRLAAIKELKGAAWRRPLKMCARSHEKNKTKKQPAQPRVRKALSGSFASPSGALTLRWKLNWPRRRHINPTRLGATKKKKKKELGRLSHLTFIASKRRHTVSDLRRCWISYSLKLVIRSKSLQRWFKKKKSIRTHRRSRFTLDDNVSVVAQPCRTKTCTHIRLRLPSD